MQDGFSETVLPLASALQEGGHLLSTNAEPDTGMTLGKSSTESNASSIWVWAASSKLYGPLRTLLSRTWENDLLAVG